MTAPVAKGAILERITASPAPMTRHATPVSRGPPPAHRYPSLVQVQSHSSGTAVRQGTQTPPQNYSRPLLRMPSATEFAPPLSTLSSGRSTPAESMVSRSSSAVSIASSASSVSAMSKRTASPMSRSQSPFDGYKGGKKIPARSVSPLPASTALRRPSPHFNQPMYA